MGIGEQFELEKYGRIEEVDEYFFRVLKQKLASNYCYSYDNYYKRWTAYLMGEGAEQCIAAKHYSSLEEIVKVYEKYGVERYFPI
jgi:hypothetical protein